MVGFLAAMLVVLLLRELWWHRKLNQLVELLDSIDRSLKELPAISRGRTGRSTGALNVPKRNYFER